MIEVLRNQHKINTTRLSWSVFSSWYCTVCVSFDEFIYWGREFEVIDLICLTHISFLE